MSICRRDQPGTIFIDDEPGAQLGDLSGSQFPFAGGVVAMLLDREECNPAITHPFVDAEYILVILRVV